MKTVYQPIEAKRTVHFRSLIAHVHHCASQEAAIQLLGERRSFPTFTSHFRVLDLINTQLRSIEAVSGKIPAAEITRRIHTIGLVFARLSEAFTYWAVQSKTKLLEGWAPKEAITDAMTLTMGQDAVKMIGPKALYDLLLFAVPGAGPRHTEIEVARLSADLVQRVADLHDPSGDPGQVAAARIALVNVLAYLKYALGETTAAPASLLAGKTEEQLATRTNTLRTLAGITLGITVSAHFQVASHFYKWLQDPWVLAATHGRDADALSRALTAFKERLPQIGPFAALPTLGQGDVYDGDLIALPKFKDVVEKQPTRQLPAATSEYFHPLAADASYPLGLSPAAVAGWLDTAWVLTERSQAASTDLEQLQQPATPSFAASPWTITDRGEGAIAGVASVAGYPITSPYEITSYWATSKWALRTIGVDPWTLHTREAILDSMAKHPQIPVRVTGTLDAGTLGRRPALMPIFAHVDEALARVSMSADSLAALWDMPLDRLSKYLITLGIATSGIEWRSLAEALRFIGVLQVGDVVVEPFTRHWYHGRTFTPECFQSADIVLAQLDSAKVVLKPFAFVPSSAEVARLQRDLAQVQADENYAQLPLLQWNGANQVQPSSVSIIGWAPETPGCVDIVLIPSVSRRRYLRLTSNTDTGPMTGSTYNAVLAVSDPVEPTQIGAVVPPQGAFALMP